MDSNTEKYVFQIIGTELCVEPNDGKKVFDIISEYLKANKEIIISFKNTKIITSAFMNTAIGSLYKDFTPEKINKYLKIKDIQDVDLILLKRVIETAKRYFQNPSLLEESVKKALEEY